MAKWLLQQCVNESRCVSDPKACCCPTSLLLAVSAVRWGHRGAQTLGSFQHAYRYPIQIQYREREAGWLLIITVLRPSPTSRPPATWWLVPGHVPTCCVPVHRDRAGGGWAQPQVWVLCGLVSGGTGSELGCFRSRAGKRMWWYPGLWVLPGPGTELQMAQTCPEEPKQPRWEPWSLLCLSGIQQLSAVAHRT